MAARMSLGGETEGPEPPDTRACSHVAVSALSRPAAGTQEGPRLCCSLRGCGPAATQALGCQKCAGCGLDCTLRTCATAHLPHTPRGCALHLLAPRRSPAWLWGQGGASLWGEEEEGEEREEGGGGLSPQSLDPGHLLGSLRGWWLWVGLPEKLRGGTWGLTSESRGQGTGKAGGAWVPPAQEGL